MPLYEFVCNRCSQSFEEIVSSGAAAAPACPKCARQDEVTRVHFARVSVGKKEDLRPPNIKVPTRRR